jgi:hypothetical protein
MEEAQASFAAALADAARKDPWLPEDPPRLFGPGEVASAQVVDENVSVEDLEQAMQALAVIVVRFCGRRANG